MTIMDELRYTLSLMMLTAMIFGYGLYGRKLSWALLLGPVMVGCAMHASSLLETIVKLCM